MGNKIFEFKNGLFSLYTRRFGTVAEIMIKKLIGCSFSKTIKYDLIDKEKNIEVKFSRVLKKNSKSINENNVLNQIALGNPSNRAVNQRDLRKTKFDCNIQQIKKENFHILYYGLFFNDTIEIFTITAGKIPRVPGYSNFQHDGNEGEGQFHINNLTYEWHKKNSYLTSISYDDLYKMLGGKLNANN